MTTSEVTGFYIILPPGLFATFSRLWGISLQINTEKLKNKEKDPLEKCNFLSMVVEHVLDFSDILLCGQRLF